MTLAFIFLLSIIKFCGFLLLLQVPGSSFPLLDDALFETQRLLHKLGLQDLRTSKEDTRYQLHPKMQGGKRGLSSVAQSMVFTHQSF